jgi:diguanylate cyclase (GGDEF)-like protein
MDKAATPARTAARKEEAQPPPEWREAEASLSAGSGLALLLVEGPQPPQLSVSNNNSVCHALQSSPAHAHLCDPYCGEAYKRARIAGEKTFYRCHAGLHCFTMPVELRRGGRTLAVIGGRAFLSTTDYRELAERFRVGDLRELSSPDLFRNVPFTTQDELEQLADSVARAASQTASAPADSGEANDEAAPAPAAARAGAAGETAEDHFPPGTTLADACRQVLDEVSGSFGVTSASLLLRREEGFVAVCGTGKFKINPPRVEFKKPGRARTAAGAESAGRDTAAAAQVLGTSAAGARLFPLVVADEVKGALVVDEAGLDEVKKTRLAEFCARVAMPLELLRLREELERRMRISYHLQSLTEQVNSGEPEDAYSTILRHSTELLRSERGSLQLFDEAANELRVKAAVGPRAEAAHEACVAFGEGVSGKVMREGRPLVVRDVKTAGQPPGPAERKYKTGSFISYPLIVGSRRVGVLNVTDKASGAQYDDLDLNLLDMLAPQMALALDRAGWHQKATQFQILSITDALTGLLNRRYLEERLGEELERSKRHRFAMCFLMIDIDNFKEYNDRHGHQAGDAALQLTSQCLKSALRSADVASRYGGEEFSVLLPQTSTAEALVIAERIRHRVSSTPYPHGLNQPGGAVTVSIGISSFGPGQDNPESVIRAADEALYAAKSRGKNRVETVLAPSAPDLNVR